MREGSRFAVLEVDLQVTMGRLGGGFRNHLSSCWKYVMQLSDTRVGRTPH